MSPSPASSPHSPAADARLVLGVVASVWLIVALGGGSARADVLYLVPVRLAAVAGITALLMIVSPARLGLTQRPALFTAIAAVVVALQLVPLPHGLWSALPGRAVYDRLAAVPEIGALWRPLSLSPDLTWNALLSLLPPLFFLLAAPLLGSRHRRWLWLGLLATILLSGLLGLLQLAGGTQSGLHWYQYSNFDAGTGLFANRNHQAVFLAMGIPLTTWWAISRSTSRNFWSGLAIALSIILFLLVAVATSKSRMGLVAVGLSLLLSAYYFTRQVRLPGRVLFWAWSGVLATGAATAVAIALWADNRVITRSVNDDLRVRILPDSLAAMRSFFPFGSGFGTFPTVFPRFERVQNLSPEYVNHTHSELTQILIEGGVAAALLLLLFLGWFLAALVKMWRRKGASAEELSEGRLCTILVLLPLVASITDYPIRAPLMACAFAIAAALLNRTLAVKARARPAIPPI